MSNSFRVTARTALVPLRVIIGIGFLAHGVAKLSRGPEKFGGLLHYHLGIPFRLRRRG